MKRKLVFIGAVLLALVFTTGTFAYTYTNTGTTTLNGEIVDAAWTTCEPSASQPLWESILPEGEYSSVILLPAGPGDDTELPAQYPDSGEHWEKVDDQPADDAETYVSTEGSREWERDLFELTDYVGTGSSESEKIYYVTVYYRIAAKENFQIQAMAELKTNGEVISGPTITQYGTEFTTFSYQLGANPVTGERWTWEEVNDLQAGVTMRGNARNKPALCTQVYVTVSYESTITEGELPEGDLFDITPAPDYPGDLQVRIYLTNTGALLKAYRYLNMQLYVRNSVEAETYSTQLLSMENGVAIFNIEGGSADSYTVESFGGSYHLVSDDPDEWGEGWSITPEFYCEVGQR